MYGEMPISCATLLLSERFKLVRLRATQLCEGRCRGLCYAIRCYFFQSTNEYGSVIIVNLHKSNEYESTTENRGLRTHSPVSTA
jgi:hypothetical protein